MPGVAHVPGRSAGQVHESLRRSLAAVDEARQYAVLWFAGVERRRLYRDLGLSSIYQYAVQGLDFSRSRAWDFVHLAAKLDEVAAGPRELPVRFQVELTPEQEARPSAPVERLHRLGGAPTDRAELLLEALAALVVSLESLESLESDNTDSTAKVGPRGPITSRPPVQIHVHEEAGSGRTRFLEVHHLESRQHGSGNQPQI